EDCYGTNTDAKTLCKYSEAIDTFDAQILKKVYENEITDYASSGAELLKSALDAYDANTGGISKAVNPQEYRDYIVALKQYYQAHSIKSDASMLAIPYRYIVPVNIVFNRSLQNLSSYYTDIGFVWILLFILLIVSLPYALIKKDKNLIALSCTTLL
ncbi:MAG: hypothetical protein LBD11_08795, partial [Candidatus Peribacteria bacterium]|nr:hypothetical protein [Candidatus Peribacteria bacterium]